MKSFIIFSSFCLLTVHVFFYGLITWILIHFMVILFYFAFLSYSIFLLVDYGIGGDLERLFNSSLVLRVLLFLILLLYSLLSSSRSSHSLFTPPQSIPLLLRLSLFPSSLLLHLVHCLKTVALNLSLRVQTFSASFPS